MTYIYQVFVLSRCPSFATSSTIFPPSIVAFLLIFANDLFERQYPVQLILACPID